MYQEIVLAADFIRKQLNEATPPEIGLILGTGLGQVAESIENKTELLYQNIPGFPVSTVQSHAGKLIYGTLEGKKVLAMQGRFHYYEGYTLQQVVFPVRVMGLLGIKHLVVTNAAGGLMEQMETGELMLLTDHINLLGDSPLAGPNLEQLGPRFPNMHQAYHIETNLILRQIALKLGIRLHEGVYAAVLGPALETDAEYRYIRTMGADAVGMSTVPEVLAARHMGIHCTGFSAITDLGVPGKIQSVTIEDVIQSAQKAGKLLEHLIRELLKEM